MAVSDLRRRVAPRLSFIPSGRRPGAGVFPDWRVAVLFTAIAVWLYNGLWFDLGGGYLVNSGQDQNMWEWFFAVTADSVTHLRDPFFTTFQNHPLGVNLMANTVMLGLGVPLTPVTLLFGASTTWAIVLTGGLAGTAFAWYRLMARHLVRSRVAAGIGGAFCGFAPPIVSHGNAHPNFVVLFVFPLIAGLLIRLWRGERPVRNGVLLGLAAAFQIFVGEEPLLFGATGFLVFGVVYAATRPGEARAAVRPLGVGLGVGAVLSLALVAYPLWVQFFGPQSYSGLDHESGNDVAAFTAYASDSLGGDRGVARALSAGPTEENAFFGWPLLILAGFLVVWLWRDAVARAAAVTGLVAAVLSLGVRIVVDHDDTGIPGPWKWVNELPLFESTLESRFALVCVPALGVLLALATDRVRAATLPFPGRGGLPVRLVWTAALTMALLPIAPTPLDVEERRPVPAFFADGHWRDFVDDGSVVVVPLPSVLEASALHWQVEAGMGFPLAEGYFVGPWGPKKRGVYGPERRPTSVLLNDVAYGGGVPEITDQERWDVRADLEFWDADVVVLPRHGRGDDLVETVDALLGPGRRVADVWVWDVRNLPGAGG